ncbi:hypothetical protein ACC692_38540, partial [Rhizobium ruizarguesonis]
AISPVLPSPVSVQNSSSPIRSSALRISSRQSDHFPEYQTELHTLIERGLVYPAFLTRGEVKERVAAYEATGESWPRD